VTKGMDRLYVERQKIYKDIQIILVFHVVLFHVFAMSSLCKIACSKGRKIPVWCGEFLEKIESLMPML
jgi:hypothetical protein